MNWQPIETAPRDGTRILVYAEIFPEVAVAEYLDDGWWPYPRDDIGPYIGILDAATGAAGWLRP